MILKLNFKLRTYVANHSLLLYVLCGRAVGCPRGQMCGSCSEMCGSFFEKTEMCVLHQNF